MADIARPDLCIVGAGALGIALAQHARRLGAEVVLVDRGRPEAGDGPRDAIALAALKNIAAGAQTARTDALLGLGSAEPKIRFKAVQERLMQVGADWAPEISHDRLAALGISVLSGATRFLDGGSIEVGDTQIRPRQTILAIGGGADVPDIAGLDQVEFFTSDTLLQNTRKLTHLLVIGGGPDALALAQAYRRLGSQVTLVPQGPVLSGCDREAVQVLLEALTGEGLRILDGGTLSEVVPRTQGIGATVEMADGTIERLDLSHILVAAGRRADIDGLDLEKARIRPAKGKGSGLEIGPVGRTGHRAIRVTGTAAGIAEWHQALSHGRAVVDSILGGGGTGATTQPTLVLTEPGLSQFGTMPAVNAVPRGNVSLVRANMGENGAALACGQRNGMVKVLVDAKGQILAASAVGAGAAEIGAVLALAKAQGIALDQLARLALPEPSLLGVVASLGQVMAGRRPPAQWAARRQRLRRLLPF